MVVLIVGTSGATNLPMQVAMVAARRGLPFVVVDPEPNPFVALAESSGCGHFAQGPAGEWVTAIVDYLCDLAK